MKNVPTSSWVNYAAHPSHLPRYISVDHDKINIWRKTEKVDIDCLQAHPIPRSNSRIDQFNEQRDRNRSGLEWSYSTKVRNYPGGDFYTLTRGFPLMYCFAARLFSFYEYTDFREIGPLVKIPGNLSPSPLASQSICQKTRAALLSGMILRAVGSGMLTESNPFSPSWDIDLRGCTGDPDIDQVPYRIYRSMEYFA